MKNQAAKDDPVALEGNEQIKLVLVALCQLARLQDRPFVICFDQVDNLDDPQLSALAHFLLDLLNTCENLLTITCGVKETLTRKMPGPGKDTKVILEAAWHRLAEDMIDLTPLRGPQGRDILVARLKYHFQAFEDVKEIQPIRRHDPLFPLGTNWLEDRLQGLIEFRPRQIINWARERWEAQQRVMAHLSAQHWLTNWNQIGKRSSAPDRSFPEVLDRKVEEKIRAQEAERRQSPHALPPSAENLAGLVERILRQCLEKGKTYSLSKVTRSAPAKKGQRPPYDLLIQQRGGPRSKEQTTGLLFLSTASAQSVAASLRRLVEDRQPPARVVLVTDERQPLPHLGAKGQERWEELQKRKGFKHRELTFEEYSALDALQNVVCMAISGDLEVEWPAGKIYPVNEHEVTESHHRADRYRAHPFLKDFLGELSGDREKSTPASAKHSEKTASSSQIETGQALDALWIGNLANQMPVNLPANVLPMHLAVVGSTGCGKTYLAKVLVEEAILQGIPVLAVDSQGDLVQFLGQRDPDQFTGNARRRFDLYRRKVEPRVYTPGSAQGIRLSLNPLRLAREADLADFPDADRRAEELQNILETVAGNLVALADCGGETDCQTLFLRKVLENLSREAKESRLDCAEIVQAVQEPHGIGIDDTNSLIKKS